MMACLIDRNRFIKWTEVPYPPPNIFVTFDHMPISCRIAQQDAPILDATKKILFRLVKFDRDKYFATYEEHQRD